MRSVPGQLRAAVDLRPPGDAGSHREPPALPLRVLLDLNRHGRSRTDDRHLAAQHVDEVGQLVERRAAQKSADARDPHVALADGQPGPEALGATDHRAQLQHVELVALAADATLAVERAAARLDADGEHRREQHRRGHEQDPRGGDHVERTPHRVPSGGAQPAGVPWRR